MDLELATIDDIIDELRRRKHRFLYVGVGQTNCAASEMTYAFQGESYEELLWMIGGLRKQLTEPSGPSQRWDADT